MRCFIFILLLPALPFQSCIALVCPSVTPSRKTYSSTPLTVYNAPYINDVESWDGLRSKKERRLTIVATPDAAAATATDSSTYLIHKGRAVNMIKRCVAIEGLSMSDGWTLLLKQQKLFLWLSKQS